MLSRRSLLLSLTRPLLQQQQQQQQTVDTHVWLKRAADVAREEMPPPPKNNPSEVMQKGAVLKRDFPAARLVTLNKPHTLNSTEIGMQCLLREFLITDPHHQDAGNYHWAMGNIATSRGNTNDKSHRSGGSYNVTSEADFRERYGGGKTGCVYVTQGAGGRSYCAGGDVVAMTTPAAGDASRLVPLAQGYLEYQLDYYLWSSSLKSRALALRSNKVGSIRNGRNKHVALLNGYVMGGGVGISLHGHYRVAAPNTVFAMPECTIGFFPDTGASYFLPRLEVPSEYNLPASFFDSSSSSVGARNYFAGLGLYLGLTAARLKGADLIHCGLATHFLEDASLFPKLADDLCRVRDPAEVESVLAAHCVSAEAIAAGKIAPLSLTPAHLDVLARCLTLSPAAAKLHNSNNSKDAPAFSGTVTPVSSVEETIERLCLLASPGGGIGGGSPSADGVAFAESLLEQLTPAVTGKPAPTEQAKGTDTKTKKALPPLSPSSMKLTLDMQRRGADEDDLGPALAMEFSAAAQASFGDNSTTATSEDDSSHRGRPPPPVTDFIEGVDALLVRKGATPPQWHPRTLAAVTPAHVQSFYRPQRRGPAQLWQPLWDPFTPFEDQSLF